MVIVDMQVILKLLLFSFHISYIALLSKSIYNGDKNESSTTASTTTSVTTEMTRATTIASTTDIPTEPAVTENGGVWLDAEYFETYKRYAEICGGYVLNNDVVLYYLGRLKSDPNIFGYIHISLFYSPSRVTSEFQFFATFNSDVYWSPRNNCQTADFPVARGVDTNSLLLEMKCGNYNSTTGNMSVFSSTMGVSLISDNLQFICSF